MPRRNLRAQGRGLPGAARRSLTEYGLPVRLLPPATICDVHAGTTPGVAVILPPRPCCNGVARAVVEALQGGIRVLLSACTSRTLPPATPPTPPPPPTPPRLSLPHS